MQLDQLDIENFRSLRGKISIPLGSSVVLVHGQNGAGKTSLLSALELALTGGVESLRRIDESYLKHLVHQGASEAKITLSALVDGSRVTSAQRVSGSRRAGQPLLGEDESRYFNDRAFLAQAALSRLLEIYEHSDAKGASAMTRFVNELLGLDHLDAQIDGLDAALDVRRTRKLVPELDDAERRQVILESVQNGLEDELAAIRLKKVEGEVHLKSLLSMPDGSSQDLLTGARQALEATAGVVPNAEAGSWRLELERFRSDLNGSEMIDQALGAEESYRVAVSRLEEWQQTDGLSLVGLLDELNDWPNLNPIDESRGYSAALRQVRDALTMDLARRQASILAGVTANENATLLASRLGERALELSIVERDLADSVDAMVLSGVQAFLASSLEHIQGDMCPLCQRDFSEVEGTGLQESVAARIAAAGEVLKKLAAANAKRNALILEIASLESEFIKVQTSAVEQSVIADQNDRIARSIELVAKIDNATPLAEVGDRLASTARELRAASVSLIALNTQSEARIERLHFISDSVGMDTRAPRIEEWIESLDATLRAKMHEFEQNLARRSLLELHAGEVEKCLEQIERLERALFESRTEIQTLVAAIRKSNERMIAARKLSQSAVALRAAILSRVFNESLNNTWRDLFMRLAPGETFTPEFMLPSEGRGRAAAKLATSQRGSNVRSGSPGMMLSSGNLNTAALTLFLALNLTAKPKLPWLVLDDPIQSMDDVHISQFAALLRSLNKESGRQIIIAVHERALFEYLRLELSPSFKGDGLTTVELERKRTGDSVAISKTILWREDPALVA